MCGVRTTKASAKAANEILGRMALSGTGMQGTGASFDSELNRLGVYVCSCLTFAATPYISFFISCTASRSFDH